MKVVITLNHSPGVENGGSPSPHHMSVERLESMTSPGAGNVLLPGNTSTTSSMDVGHVRPATPAPHDGQTLKKHPKIEESSNCDTSAHEKMSTSKEKEQRAKAVSAATDLAPSTLTMNNTLEENVAESGTDHTIAAELNNHSDGSANDGSESDSGMCTPLTEMSNTLPPGVDVYDFFAVLNAIYVPTQASTIVDGLLGLAPPQTPATEPHEGDHPDPTQPPPTEETDNGVGLEAAGTGNGGSSMPNEGTATPTTSGVPGVPHPLSCPPCVLFAIRSNLSLAIIQNLARSCEAFRNQLHPVCCEAIGNMTVKQFVTYQTERALTTPHHAVCSICHTLHRAMAGDVPGEEPCRFCPHPAFDKVVHSKGVRMDYGYIIQHHQVQLALKLKRLSRIPGSHLDQTSREYLQDVLRPFRVCSRGLNTRVAIEVIIRPVVTLEARPSFIVMRTMAFSQHLGEAAQPLEAKTIQHFAVCPHASISEYDREEMQCEALYGTIEDACLGLRTRRRFFCTRCPTDVEIETQPGRLSVSVWHDFGPEGVAPTDAAWLVHVASRDNNEYVGYRVRHGRGTVRYRYENAQRKQPPSETTLTIDATDRVQLSTEHLGNLARNNYWQRVAGRSRLEWYIYNRKVLGMTQEMALQRS